jgi:hypothetical protein
VKTKLQPQTLQTGRPAFGLASLVANWLASLNQQAVNGVTAVAAVASSNRRGTEHGMHRSGSAGATELKRSINGKNCSKIVQGLMPQVAEG